MVVICQVTGTETICTAYTCDSCPVLLTAAWSEENGDVGAHTAPLSEEFELQDENAYLGKPAEGIGKLFPELCLLWKAQ